MKFPMSIKLDNEFWTATSAIATAGAVFVALFISYRQHRKDTQKELLAELSGNLYSAELGEKACNMVRSVINYDRNAEHIWRTKSAIHRAYDMVVDARSKVKDQEVADQLQRIYAKLYDVKFLLDSPGNYQNDKELLRDIIAWDNDIVLDTQLKLQERILILKSKVEVARKNFDKYWVWPWQ